MSMKIIRVFPRKTNMTPDDDLAFTTGPPLYELEHHPVHVSVTFTWDRARGDALAKQWQRQGFDVTISASQAGKALRACRKKNVDSAGKYQRTLSN